MKLPSRFVLLSSTTAAATVSYWLLFGNAQSRSNIAPLPQMEPEEEVLFQSPSGNGGRHHHVVVVRKKQLPTKIRMSNGRLRNFMRWASQRWLSDDLCERTNAATSPAISSNSDSSSTDALGSFRQIDFLPTTTVSSSPSADSSNVDGTGIAYYRELYNEYLFPIRERALIGAVKEGEIEGKDCVVADVGVPCRPAERVLLASLALLPSPLPVASLTVALFGVRSSALACALQKYFGKRMAAFDIVDSDPTAFAAAENYLGMSRLVSVDEGVIVAHRGVSFESFLFMSSAARRFHAIILDHSSNTIAACGSNNKGEHKVVSEELVRMCHASLRNPGVLAISLQRWDESVVASCREVFGSRNTWVVSCPNLRHPSERNSKEFVVFAARHPALRPLTFDRRHFVQRCKKLGIQHDFQFDLAAQLPMWWQLW